MTVLQRGRPAGGRCHRSIGRQTAVTAGCNGDDLLEVVATCPKTSRWSG